MSYSFEPASGDAECREHGRDMAEAFAGQEAAFQDWTVKQGADSLRILRHDEDKVAGLVRLDFAQYFGGKAVPAAGIAAVVVPAHQRGQGHGYELMLRTLQEIHSDGVGLSPLYAAAPRLYSNLGWAMAGSHVRWRVLMSDITVDESSADVRPWDGELATLKQVYNSVAPNNPGWLARPDFYWQRILQAPGDSNPVKGYVVFENDEPTGYVVFQHHRNSDASRFWLQLRDFQFASHESGKSLFRLIKTFSSTSAEFLFARGSDDPMFAYLSPRAQRSDFTFNWFQRIAHVQNALESRGYRKSFSGAASLRVKDDQLPGNSHAFNVSVESGSAVVRIIDRAETEIDVGGLASLYCGRFSPAQLRQLGSLRGDDSQDDLLGSMFAGVQSSLPDFF